MLAESSSADRNLTKSFFCKHPDFTIRRKHSLLERRQIMHRKQKTRLLLGPLGFCAAWSAWRNPHYPLAPGYRLLNKFWMPGWTHPENRGNLQPFYAGFRL